VPAASAALGSKVATVEKLLSAVLPETGPPAPTTWIVVVPLTTVRSNVTEMFVPTDTPVAFAAGVRAVTDGPTTVENDHDSGVIDAPAALVAPDATTVYVVVEVHGAEGVNVAVFVDEL
jgi:hypothetical protein